MSVEPLHLALSPRDIPLEQIYLEGVVLEEI
jgi:hypothetical protein